MSAEAAIDGVEPDRLVDPQARVIDYLRVSVTDRCNYGCSYCMPRGRRRATPPAPTCCRSRRSPRWCGCFVSLGVRRVRLTGGEPTVRRDLPTLVRLLRAIPGLERDRAVQQRPSAGGAGGAAARGRRRPPQHQPRLARRRALPPHHAPGRSGARASRASRRRAPPASPRSSSTRWRFAASTTTNSIASAPGRGSAASFRASSRRCRWRTGARTCPARRCRQRRSAVASPPPGREQRPSRRRRTPRTAPARRAIFASSPAAPGDLRAPLRHHLADDRALLHDLQPPAAVDGGRAARLPRATTTPSICARLCARAARTRSRARSGRRSPASGPGTRSS